MNNLSGVLKKSGHDIYENIAGVLLLSLIGSLPVIPGILLISLPYSIIYLLFTGMPCMAGVLYSMEIKLSREPFRYTLFFKGFIKYYFKAFVFGAMSIMLILIPVSSFWYYTKVKTLMSFTVAMFQLYLCIMIFVALAYTLPLMVVGENSLSQSIKMSFKYFIDNMGYTFGSFVQVLTISMLLIVTVISMPMLFAGMYSIFTINLYENLLLKYQGQKGRMESMRHL